MVTLSPTCQARQESILEAAIKVFAHFGYRKTSMEDVARAAEVSRQCIYGHFSTKKSLFRATVIHVLDASFVKVSEILEDSGLPLHKKVVRIFDELEGEQVTHSLIGRWELLGASFAYAGESVFEAYRERLDRTVERLVVEAMAGGLVTLKQATPGEVAEVLREVSGGIASRCERREDFRERMEKAVRVILPLEPVSA